jgi:hypothetical protein
MKATINFVNRSEIEAEKNSDCYIVATKPDFPEPLGEVVVTSDDGEKHFQDALLIECASIDGRYWFALMETPEDEKLKRRITELESTNGMLSDCILEMSEIVYA